MVYKKDTGGYSKRQTKTKHLEAVRVLDIILDINHPLAEKYGGYDAIGTITFTYLKDNTPFETPRANRKTAIPFFSFIKKYPLRNEIVLIASTFDKNTYNSNSRTNYYFPDLNVWNHPHHNALPTGFDQDDTRSAADYQRTEAGISRQVTDGSTDINLGQYFSERLDIKPLLPYEGDTIIEGRFGNSIRFGSTVVQDDPELIPEENKNIWSEGAILPMIGDPITIIRNGQKRDINDNKGWIHTTEDINSDDSSIYLTSNQQIKGFIPASENDQSYLAFQSIPL